MIHTSPSPFPSVALRPAAEADAPFIAAVVMEALGGDVMGQPGNLAPDADIVAVCQRSDTLYSWQNAVVATLGGVPVGAMVAYRGEAYRRMRRTTFGLLRERLHFDAEAMDDEARAGEYYIDSVAVTPASRGHGIGRLLLLHAVERAASEGLAAVLACDPANVSARRLYERLGFRADGSLHIFGAEYLRMVHRK